VVPQTQPPKIVPRDTPVTFLPGVFHFIAFCLRRRRHTWVNDATQNTFASLLNSRPQLRYNCEMDILVWLSWIGNPLALLGSYMIGGGNLKGWWAYLAADFCLIGLPIQHRLWSLAVLFALFIATGLRGLYKSGQLKWLSFTS